MNKIIPLFIASILFAINIQAQTLSSKITTLISVRCPSDSNGSAAATVHGGFPPYTYLWLPSGQTRDTAVGLHAAIPYTVTVTDSAADTSISYVTLSATSTLGVSTSSSEVSCFGLFNGSAFVLPYGGVAPYLVRWMPGGDTTRLDTALSAGTYTATVTDLAGCTSTSSVAVPQPPPLALTAVSYTNIAVAIASGGTAPYSFSWSPGGYSADTVSGLHPGTYTVTVNDANLCTNSVVVTIDTSVINYSFADISNCSSPTNFSFNIYASSRYPTIFNNCVIDLKYTGGKFSGDSVVNGGIIVTQNTGLIAGSGNDYNILNTNNLSDSVLQITFGDTANTSPSGLFLDSIPKPLLAISFKVQNGCQPGSVSFTNEFSTGTTACYTLATKYLDSITIATISTDSLYNPHTCDSLVNPYPCDPYTYWNSLTSSYETSYLTCYDTISYTCYDTTVKYTTIPDSIFTVYSHNFPYNSDGYYLGNIYAPYCGSAISGFSTGSITAGTNSRSSPPRGIPPNSSILTINGYGFGSIIDSVKVTNANDSGSMFKLDNMDILRWTDSQIKIKMPSYMLMDTDIVPPAVGHTPGTGPIALYTACGEADTAHLQINYNIENDYHNVTHYEEKTRPVVIRYLDSVNFYWRCDTSISNNPKALACVRYAINVWNCYTGIHAQLGLSDTFATHSYYGASNIYMNPLPPHKLMETNQIFLNSCYDYVDSLSYYNAANIQINSAVRKWSYDTTGTQTSKDSNYFFDAILHELGHAYGLNHINDSFSLMYWYQLPGKRVNILSSGMYPGPATLMGGLDMVATSYDNPPVLACLPDSGIKSIIISCFDGALSTPPAPKNAFELSLYPNPINGGNLTIAYELTKTSYLQFKITDCTGRIIMSLNTQKRPPGEFEEHINIDNLAQGVYLFVADINGEYKTIKFIKI